MSKTMSVIGVTFLLSILFGWQTPCLSVEPERHSSALHAQLKQDVADLQQNPNDHTLREKIIKLALILEPKPAIPETAERHMARGAAAIKDAKDETGFKEAANEFEKASLAAPWLADAYYNQGMAQSKASDYAGAAVSLQLYLLAAPDAPNAKEAKGLMYEMEYRQEKAAEEASPEAQAAKKQQELQEFLSKLDGGLWEMRERFKDCDRHIFEIHGKEVVRTLLVRNRYEGCGYDSFRVGDIVAKWTYALEAPEFSTGSTKCTISKNGDTISCINEDGSNLNIYNRIR